MVSHNSKRRHSIHTARPGTPPRDNAPCLAGRKPQEGKPIPVVAVDFRERRIGEMERLVFPGGARVKNEVFQRLLLREIIAPKGRVSARRHIFLFGFRVARKAECGTSKNRENFLSDFLPLL